MRLNRLAGCAALLVLLCILFAPALGQAEEIRVGEEAKAACVAAGGELLEQMCIVCVLSPYGTQSVVLRDVPSDSYDAVAMLMVGQEVMAVGMTDQFYFVVLEDDLGFGWLASDELEEIR